MDIEAELKRIDAEWTAARRRINLDAAKFFGGVILLCNIIPIGAVLILDKWVL